ncbi:MAG: MATE family efflux transporter [Thermosphaera sp.]
MESLGKYRENILNGPIGKTLLWLGLPLMLVQLVNISYNLVDSFWLSRYNEIALAVPRQVWPTFMFLNSIIHGLMTANLAIISQLIGGRRYDEAHKTVSQFITVALVLNIGLAIAYFYSRPYIFKHLVQTPLALYDDVLGYSGVISLDIILSALTLSYSTILQSIGDTRTPAYVNLVAAFTNFILDPPFIIGLSINESLVIPPMGAVGAAVATVLSRFAGLAALILFLRRRYPYLAPRLTRRLDKNWVLMSLKIGAPVTLMMSSNSLAFMFQNALINQYGEFVAAAAAIGFLLMDLADAFLWGFTSSVAVMIGQSLGANLTNRAKRVARIASLYISVSTGIAALIVYVFRNYFIGIFAQNSIVYEEAQRFVALFLPSLPFFTLFFIGMSVGRGAGKTLIPTIMGMVRLWGIRLALGYFLSFTMGLGTMGIWISMAISNYLSGIAMYLWVHNGSWAISLFASQEKIGKMGIGNRVMNK